MRRALSLFALIPCLIGTALSSPTVVAGQTDSPVWNSAVIWQPSLNEAGVAVSELVNQIDARCNLDIDPIVPTAEAGPEGSVYGFVATWGCPNDTAESPVSTWNSALIWQPTMADAGVALAEHMNQIDARCSLDVDTITATYGTGPEGPVYAFLVTWAC